MRKWGVLAGIALLGVGHAEAQSGPAYQPRVLAHVCTWFDAGSWRKATTNPLRGTYRSTDSAVLYEQLVQMRSAGIAPLVSWVGSDHPAGDGYLDMIVTAPETGVPAAVLYEGQFRLQAREDGWIDFDNARTQKQFTDDMRYLYERYLSRYPERFMREDGRFVVMAWPSHIYRGAFKAVGQSVMTEFPLYLVSTDLLMRPYIREDAADVIGGFAAVSAYGIYLPELPGELGATLDTRWLDRMRAMTDAWDRWLAVNEPQVRLALPLEFAFDDHLAPGSKNPVWTTDYGIAREMTLWAGGVIDDSHRRAGRYLPWATAASWNEHFEGSAIEPTDRHGARFLDLITEFSRSRQR
jgi:hypothetical protein